MKRYRQEASNWNAVMDDHRLVGVCKRLFEVQSVSKAWRKVVQLDVKTNPHRLQLYRPMHRYILCDDGVYK